MRLNGRHVWRAARLAFGILLTIVFVPVVFALVGVAVECRVFNGRVTQPDTPKIQAGTPPDIRQLKEDSTGYTRSEDQTYLTLPEWYIVYSADEYATFTATNRPSHFPYFGAIRQFWGSYYDVCSVTREQYTFNSGYHVVLTVIGTSFTIENMARGMYENTVGRVTEWLSAGGRTEEDEYAQEVAQEYGTFLHTIPWYEFPFGAKLRGLWRETPLLGPNIIRKWERKFALSLEYGSKMMYGWLIKKATQGAFSAQDLEIQVWARGITPEVLEREPRVRVVQDGGDWGSIAVLPRYEAFTVIVPRLVTQGTEFVEIAGNDEILVTMIAPATWDYDLAHGTPLFEMPVLTQPERKRIALNVPVTALHVVLDEIRSREIDLEHLYDY